MRRAAFSPNVLIIAASIAGSSMVMLGESVVTLALPSIGKTLQVPFASLQWVVDGYNLTLAAFILLGGSLGDLFGLRRVYLWSACVFLVLSLLCALAWSGPTLILFRALLGIAGALLTPVSLAVLNAQLPKAMRSRAVGYWTAATSIMLALGPLVGGYLVDLFSWRAIFLFNVPLALIAITLAFVALKEAPIRRGIHIDWAGAVLAFLFLGGIAFGLIEGPANGWPAITIAALVAGAMCFAAFVWWESRAAHPLVDLSLFRNRNFSATNGATLLLYAAFGGFGFLFSYFLQTTANFSTTATGAGVPARVGDAGTLLRPGGRICFTRRPPLADDRRATVLFGRHVHASLIGTANGLPHRRAARRIAVRRGAGAYSGALDRNGAQLRPGREIGNRLRHQQRACHRRPAYRHRPAGIGRA
ncbi:MAG TPA: MFS transporter [Aestuariivirga sp.]|nr:MFS transporter [Aestuariivirga sp.]